MNNPPISLVQQAVAGDRASMDALIDSVHKDLWGFLVGRLRSITEAEDVYQETWMKVTQSLHTLQDAERFRSWLFAIAFNTLRSHKRKDQLMSDVADLEIESKGPAPIDQVIAKARWRTLRHALHQLSERQRETLLLEAVGDLPQKEIAEMLGDNLNTVKTHIRRARIRLARQLAEVGLD